MAERCTSSKLASGAKRAVAVETLARSFGRHERVFLPGSAGECAGLTEALCAADAVPLHITASFIPGINPVPVASLPKGTTFANMFANAGIAAAQVSGAFQHLPLAYSAFAKYVAEQVVFDACVVQVAPPGADGRCSLGAAVEFTPIVAKRSKRILAVINPRMPVLPDAASLPLADFHLVAECDAPLREYHAGPVSAEAQQIADTIARFVDDGAALQIGLGKVPDALLRNLTARRGLRLHSGMISDGVMALASAGALDPDWVHTSCVHVGSAAYYAWLDGRTDFAVHDCSRTHAAAVLSVLPRLVAVNAALSVDLFGQANLEQLDGRMISGVGGAPDFARGASQSPGGISLVALPSTSRKGELSRIVASLDGPCSIPRSDIDVIVTEHGAADLRGCSVIERARRLILIAAPQHRAALEEAFHGMAKKL